MNSCFSEKNNLKIMAKGGIGISILLISMLASADQFDVLNYSASAGVTYDNNLFRLPSWVDPLQAIGRSTKSDLAKTESVGINLDKNYANQEVLFKGNVTNNTFNTFSYLNYTNTTYSGTWNLSLTPRVSASLSDSRNQTLNSFTDIHVYTRNLTTTDTPRLSADWWLESNWHLTFAVTANKTTSSQSVINNQSFISQAKEWGVKYSPADGSSIAFISRVVQSENINSALNYNLLVDTQNTEYQKELDVNWLLSGKSALSGNLMYIDHQYPVFFERNYSGVQGGVNYFLGISDKTNLNLSFNRGISSWNDVYSSYYVNDTLALAPNWQISSNTLLRIVISRTRANYFGPIISGTTARYDQSQSSMLEFDWTPQRSVKISASMQNSNRASSNVSYGYDDKSASLSVQVSF